MSALPDLLWARLRVLGNGVAEVLDLDGRVTRFATKEEARQFLREDGYGCLDELDVGELAELGLPFGKTSAATSGRRS